MIETKEIKMEEKERKSSMTKTSWSRSSVLVSTLAKRFEKKAVLEIEEGGEGEKKVGGN